MNVSEISLEQVVATNWQGTALRGMDAMVPLNTWEGNKKSYPFFEKNSLYPSSNRRTSILASVENNFNLSPTQ